jgi:ribosomal protein S18 acetylase RimI-like enzyme
MELFKIDITEKNLSILEDFFKDEKSESFRYYDKRPFSIISSHILTTIYTVNNESVGYGHLDKEEDRKWLGIIVSKHHRGKGYGNIIMDDILSRTDDDTIYLSVDKANFIAINLYKNKGFVVESEEETYLLMKKIK